MFACTLFVLMRSNSPSLRLRYSCVCGGIALVSVYVIFADTVDDPVFLSTLLVRVRKNNQSLRVRYLWGCVRIAYVCVYGVRSDADEFGCMLFMRLPMNSPCFRVRYSCGHFCVYVFVRM